MKRVLAASCMLCFGTTAFTQVTVGFQGGEPGDTWGYTSTGASALSLSEAQQSPNKTTGTTSLVVGGDTGGGNCFASGSGNGPSVARTFTFSPLDISSSSASVRTLTLNWGNRFPSCSGTGWDSGENLVFTAYHDGVAQTPVTLIAGSNNAPYSIQTHSHTWSVPACVTSFHFVISITTNRADELLFIDDVKLTAPQLNGSLAQPSVIAGNTTICPGSAETYSVAAEPGVSYTWAGLPSGASFTTPNGTTASSITVNWGTAPQGTYTLTVTPSNACGGTGTTQTVSVTILPPPVPVTISDPASLCSGETIILTSSYASGNTWSPGGAATPSINVTTAGTYTVSVAAACGTVTASYAIALNPAPAIQSVTNTPISCFGANDGTITVNSADTGLEYSTDGINWQTNSTFSNLAPGTYTLQVRNANGCTITLSPVQLTQPNAVTANASNTGPYCTGAVIVLNGTTSSAGTPSFSWTGQNGYTSIAQDPTDATEAGAYNLVVSVNGCTSLVSSTTVIIRTAPVASASNTGPYCAGAALQLNSTAASPGTFSYSWSGPNGFTSTAQDPANASLEGTYQVIITENGCASAPASTTIVINPLPDAQAGYNAPFCTGSALQLNGTTSSTGTISYAWTGPNGYTAAVQHPTDATAAGTYTLTVTASGCTGSPASVTVISEAPALQVSNAGPFCEGTPVQLNSSTPVPGTIIYSWTGPNGYTSSLQNPSDATQGGIYSVVISVNNCTNLASTVVTVNPNPTAGFSFSPACMEDSMHFTAICSVPNPGFITTWNWNFGDGTTSQEQHPEHSFNGSGSYPVTLAVRTASNCTANITQNVVVNARPQADFHFSPGALSVLDPEAQFMNTSSDATDFLWDFGYEDNQSTALSPVFTYPSSQGDYIVQLIAYNAEGCADSITKTLSVKEELIYYIPNAFTPDGDEFNQLFTPVFSSGFDPENYTLLLFNRWGEVIFESHDIATGWDGTYKGQSVPAGDYAWNIRVKHRQTDAFETMQGQLTLLR